MKHVPLLLLAIVDTLTATVGLGRREGCSDLRIFGARETTAPPGFGTAATVVSLIQRSYPAASAESIIYPAAGGNLYEASVAAGVRAVAAQTNSYFQKCPNTTLVMVGYSQGAQIIDDAFCGGPDGFSLNTTRESVSAGVSRMVAAIILMGNPRHVPGRVGDIGNATAGGFAARPFGYQCPAFASLIRSYCDEADPFCAKGNSSATHQGYGQVYGQDAVEFVTRKLAVVDTSVSDAARPKRDDTLVVNSAGGAYTQKSLIQVCRDEPDIDIILLAFLTSATNIDEGLNFANSYRPTEQEIIECQSQHHKTILLSLGGAITDNTWSFASENQAVDAANRIWAAFGPASRTEQSTTRPFGVASVDGFDLDFEAPFSNVHVFAQHLRNLMNSPKVVMRQRFYLTAAPQCPFPDTNLHSILHGDMATVLDFVFVQFYNNAACDLRTPDGFETSLRVWHSQWAKTSGARIFMGVPGAATAIGAANRASYIEGSVLAADYIRTARSFPSFAGVMVWDMSQLDSNTAFLPPIVDALSRPVPRGEAPIESAPGSRIQAPRRSR
ncbi:glycoside hydrolase superfamily [Xylaria castorea]|nr:glycoside hydrolase superfamily [Xylaria castorea]